MMALVTYQKTMLKFAFPMQQKYTSILSNRLQLFWIVSLMVAANITFAQKSGREYNKSLFLDSGSVYIDSAKAMSLNSPLKAIEVINKAIEWSIRKNEPFNESEAYLILGTIQQNRGQHDLAISQFRKSIQALDRLEHPKNKYSDTKRSNFKTSIILQEIRFTNYLYSAQSHINLNNLIKADEFVKLCLSGAFNNLPIEQINEAKRAEAQILILKGQTNQAIQKLNSLIESEKLNKNKAGEIETLLQLGFVYKQIGNLNQSKESYNIAKRLAEQYRLSNLAQKANEQLAILYQNEGNYDDEINARNNSLNLNYQISSTNTLRKDNFEEQRNLSSDKQQDRVLESSKLQSSGNDAQIAEFKSNPKQELNTEIINPKQEGLILQENAKNLKRLAEVYTQKNDVNKAVDYYIQYAKLQDSIIAAKTNELASIIALSTNIGKNQQRIEMMEQERELNEKSIEILQQDRDLKQSQLKNRNIIITTLSFAFALLLVGGLFFFRNLRAKRKADKLLTLQSLGGQMNPHFIFNALNSVNEYIAANDERAANRYLSDFSKLMRKVLDDSRHAFIPLSEELTMLKLYLQLEHARFKDKFDYELQVNDNLVDSDWLIPPMLIQPYIENAVWHGLRYLDSKGKLNISIDVFEQSIVVSIVDNGIGIEKSRETKTKNQKKQTSMGMKNIETRVKLINELYQTNISIAVKPSFLDQENPGTTVIITIAIPSTQ